MSEGTARCVICAKEAEHGYLCGDHYVRLNSTLREIEDEAAILDTAPSLAQRTGLGSGTLPSHRVPVNLDAVVATDPRRGLMRWGADDFDPWGLDDTASVLETLHDRARMVREDLGYTPPPTVTITSERTLLTDELPWIARQPWADELLDDMAKLLGQLQRTNKTRPDRPVGLCHLPQFGSVCGGRIWRRQQKRPVWRIKADRCVREKVEINDGPAYCERCRSQWDGKELDRLRLIEEQRQVEAARPRTDDGRRMLTAEELVAKGLVSSVSNVRVIAHRRGYSAVRGHYDPEWFDAARRVASEHAC